MSLESLGKFEHSIVMSINAEGVFNCLPTGESIVNVASFAGTKGIPKGSAYAASKHAVLGLTKCGAIEAGSRNIRINAESSLPGLVSTQSSRALVSVGRR